MGRQKRRVKKAEVQPQRMMNNITEDRFLQLQTQAFYDAMKKIEEEKNTVTEVKIEKMSMLQNIGFMLLLIIWPNKAKEKYDLRDDITNGVFSMISSIIMWLIGNAIKLFAFLVFFADIYCVAVKVINIGIFIVFLFGAFFMGMIGSMFVLSSEEIANERNNSVIMSYTSNIFAAVGIVVAVVAIVLSA